MKHCRKCVSSCTTSGAPRLKLTYPDVDTEHAEHDDPRCRVLDDAAQDGRRRRFLGGGGLSLLRNDALADRQVGDDQECEHQEASGPDGGCEALLLKELAEEHREQNRTNSCPTCGDPNDEAAFPSKVRAEDRKAWREHEPQGEAHAHRLGEEDLPERCRKAQGEYADKPADRTDGKLVPEPTGVEEDATVQRRREGQEQVTVR